MARILAEFREFAVRGSVVDLAVGVIIGAAFNSIVKSLVDQVIMPPIGLATGGLDFSKLEWVLRPENPATAVIEKVAVQYGAFLNTVVQFLIVAFVVFMLVKAINRLRRQEAEAPSAPPAPTAAEALLTEIRDELRAGRQKV
ncbi:MAG TPA: large-conductance mechanosensitive channel protein MscL [Caulobacteraceae bacterium]